MKPLRSVKGANLGRRETRALLDRVRRVAEAKAGSRVAQDLLWKKWRCRIVANIVESDTSEP